MPSLRIPAVSKQLRKRLDRLLPALLAIFLVLVTGCAADSNGDEPRESNTAVSTSEANAIVVATTALPDSTSSSVSALVEVTSNLVYHLDDDRFDNAKGLVDVVAPTTDGPWSVVVAFHGDPRFANKSWMLPMATDIAVHGRVVFVPDWGHTAAGWRSENSLEAEFNLMVREVRCAVVFARSRAHDYGGDPNRITVYGFSAGANAALMAGLSDTEPLEACAETGPGVVPQAVVSGDGDVLLGAGGWDAHFAEEPEAFYAFTPWRYLDASDAFPIYIAATENSFGPYDRSIGSDPSTSFLVDRHIDVDLVGELDAMGLLEDGGFSLRDSNEWAYKALLDTGYDAEWVLLPDSTHESFSSEGRALLIDTVVNAEREQA